MNNIQRAIAAAKNQDPSTMSTALGAELANRVQSAIDDKKIEIGQNMFVDMSQPGDSDDD